MAEMVNHPDHYNTGSGTECIDIIRHLPLSLGTAVKYLWRFRLKFDPQEDLDKAVFYLRDYEKHLFKGKTTDGEFHTATTMGAGVIIGSSLRSDLRKHIVWLLESDFMEEYDAFTALYDFLVEASKGRVSHDKFSEFTREVDNISKAKSWVFSKELEGADA